MTICLLYVEQRQVHLELIKSTRSTNEAYGIQILFSMTISFVFITSLLYYAYSIIWMNLDTKSFRQEMIPLIGWILFYASKVLIINHTCALASIEVNILKITNNSKYISWHLFNATLELFLSAGCKYGWYNLRTVRAIH